MTSPVPDSITPNGLTLRATLLAGRASDVLDSLSVPDDASSPVELSIHDTTVRVPTAVVAHLQALLEELAHGSQVVVAPAQLRVGTTEASRLLGVSRPWLTQLIDRGALPAERAGSKRRITLGALMAEKRKRARELAGVELSAFDDEPDPPPPAPDRSFLVPTARRADIAPPRRPDDALTGHLNTAAADGDYTLAA